jgi:hypothetical protein
MVQSHRSAAGFLANALIQSPLCKLRLLSVGPWLQFQIKAVFFAVQRLDFQQQFSDEYDPYRLPVPQSV